MILILTGERQLVKISRGNNQPVYSDNHVELLFSKHCPDLACSIIIIMLCSALISPYSVHVIH